MQDIIGLDFETYSGTDLPVHGLERYVTASTFTPLIGSVVRHNSDSDPWNPYRRDTVTLYHGNRARRDYLGDLIGDNLIAAHNAPFEQRVLKAIGLDYPSKRFRDSAVVARAMGAGSSLEAAAPQLLGIDKLESGKNLIRLFSIPGKLQEENDSLYFDDRIITMHPFEWREFIKYCELDAELSLRLVLAHESGILPVEWENAAVTTDMNNTGWPVDVPMVEEMQRRYLENIEAAEAAFRAKHNATELNLNSLKQMKEWCEARGVKAKSFDEENVAKLIARIEKKLDDADAGRTELSMAKYQNYCEVLDLLRTKQTLGGSSLKKLQVILDTTGKDCRLRDQYLHVGAGQSYRTSGRGVQMQNLKRLSEVADMAELDDLEIEWDNDKLAENIRQCFTSSHPQGALIVGDFSSVESRGLGWLAGEKWKLDAYRRGQDLYKVSAAKQFIVPYETVTKEQRQFGKVGELSCGYQAGGGAVQSFAAKMGVTLTEPEASKLVADWRATNPMIVDLWDRLDVALNEVVDGVHMASVRVGPRADHVVRIQQIATPVSLLKQHKNVQSVSVSLARPNGTVLMERVIHGLYRRGRDICYFKPSARKTGDLWNSHFVDPKTKQLRFYNIYGGKLAGILTQSFCRELFFEVLRGVHDWVGRTPDLALIGQFHDEIVLDWTPACDTSLDGAKQMLESSMTAVSVPDFPMAAEIKHDYRYTK